MEKCTHWRAKAHHSPADFADIIRLIHRNAGASVAFQAKNRAGEMKTLGACDVAELDLHNEQLRAFCDGDFYFSVNSVGKGKRLKNGLRFALRESSQTRHLNAIIADLDIGRPNATGAAGMSVQEGLQGLVDAISDGIIPQPSMIARSGQGVNVLWLLHDPKEPTQSPKAWAENVEAHKRISVEIVKRLAHLESDEASTDVARVLRVDGSTNTKSREKVIWQPLPYAQNGGTASYTLEELEALVNCQKPTRKFFGRATKHRGSAPNRRRGAEARARYRADDLRAIARHRGGWKQGQRWWNLSLFAHLLHDTGANKSQVKHEIEAMAQECQPAFPSDSSDGTIKAIVDAAFAPERVAYPYQVEKLLRRLGVTETEARELNLRSIVPQNVREERQQQDRAGKRPAAKEARLKALGESLQAQPNASAAELLEALKAQGIQASLATVKRDLAANHPERQIPTAGRPAAQGSRERGETPPSISISFEPIYSTPVEIPDQTGKLLPAPIEEAGRDSATHRPEVLPVAPAFSRCTWLPYSPHLAETWKVVRANAPPNAIG